MADHATAQIVSDGPQPIRSSGNLSVRAVEEALRTHPAEVDGADVHLDLRSCRHVQIGAGWRIANAMSRWSVGAALTVDLPKDVAIGEAEWFKVFTRSGVGKAIAEHASQVLQDGRDVSGLVQQVHAVPLVEATNHVMLADLSRRVEFSSLPAS